MNAGVCLNKRGGRQCRVSSLLFAVDAVLIADSVTCLQGMENETVVMGGRRKQSMVVNKGKVSVVTKSGEYEALHVQLDEGRMEELNTFNTSKWF